ncbi:MAG TPA: ABC transporter permease [Pyrinomonadaceae bacterium]|nr:ABC transporter permease [Pyrinomonadaceae bacterium]
MMRSLLQDIRYGLRTMRGNVGFTVVAVVALALGVGANTAIFSVVNAVLLRPLQYPNAERLVAIQELNREGRRGQVTPANFIDWREQSTAFEHLAAVMTRPSNLAVGDEAERVSLAVASASFFDVFGVRPASGRLFEPGDEKAGHAPVAVLSYGLWQRRFGGDPAVVGRAVTLDGRSYTVVGVAPQGFQYPERTEAWLPPLRLAPEWTEQTDVTRARGFGYLSAVGLLKPGVTLERAREEMETITARLRAQYPETNNNRFNRVVTLQEHLVGESGTALLMLLGAVGLVLLIACANVANLLLARAAARQKEIAVRVALGATRLRLARQLLVESLLLAMLGGAAGLLLGWWGVDLLKGMMPEGFPRVEGVGIDLPVLSFTLLVSVATGVLFGLAPAVQFTKPDDVHASLKESARGSSGGARRSRLRSLLIVSEVALSLVLLVGAGLLFRSFLRLSAVELGFRPQQVLTFRVSPSGTNFRQNEQFSNFYAAVAERVAALPGVESVGAVNTLPLTKGPTTGFRIEGAPETTPDKWPSVNYRGVTHDYFRAANIPLVQGRFFDGRDHAASRRVVLVNQAAARQHFGGDAVGKRINFGSRDPDGRPSWFEIVGVVADVRSVELGAEPTPEIYTTYTQDPFVGMTYVVRSAVEPTSLAGAVREAVRQVDKAQPVTEVKTLEQHVGRAAAEPRFNSLLLGLFAGVALLLAAAGIYGVMSYAVTQRLHEIGIRMALGAQGRDVLRLVVGQGMALALIGVGAGLVASLALTRLMRGLLYGVTATDPGTYAVVSLLLTAVALAACLVPARRAMKVDPMVALRHE